MEGGLKKISTRLVIALFKFDAKKDSPGGFHELSVQKGKNYLYSQKLTLYRHTFDIRIPSVLM